MIERHQDRRLFTRWLYKTGSQGHITHRPASNEDLARMKLIDVSGIDVEALRTDLEQIAGMRHAWANPDSAAVHTAKTVLAAIDAHTAAIDQTDTEETS